MNGTKGRRFQSGNEVFSEFIPNYNPIDSRQLGRQRIELDQREVSRTARSLISDFQDRLVKLKLPPRNPRKNQSLGRKAGN